MVHFIGGAFAGASPQLTYRLFLEQLSDACGWVVVATPFSTSFDHLRVADDAQFCFDRAVKLLGSRVPADLPVWGVGHSMGALAHTLIASRYALKRSGLVLISWNNKPASDAIPLFAPVISPLAQTLSPLLAGLATSPFRPGAEALSARLRATAPPAVREALPLLDQLQPLSLDLVYGRTEFIPSPADTARLVRSFYAAPRTLLVRFKDDGIDETPALAATLAGAASAGEVTIDTLGGGHTRPLGQSLPPPPPQFVDALSQGIAAAGALGSLAEAFGAPPAALSMLRSSADAAGKMVLDASAPGAADAAERDSAELVGVVAGWAARGDGDTTGGGVAGASSSPVIVA